MLLKKLEAYGVRGNEQSCFEDYLNGCNQKVALDREALDLSDIKRGVPQWSILCPLLFNIFLSRLRHVVNHSTFHFYADDIMIYVSDCDLVANYLNA